MKGALPMSRDHYDEAITNPMGRVTIPADLTAGPSAYALIAEGDCLSPEYGPGDVLICDPDATPAKGDFVAVWWKDGSSKPSVKRLGLGLPPRDLWGAKSELEAVLICEQLNPPKRLSARLSTVDAVHKVIGKAGAEVRADV
jgi:phage repressor protein C with HTH and peptisase S24 domain